MNKISSKLAAGVRKVKAQQAEAPVAEKPPRSGGGTRAMRDGGVDGPAKQAARSGAGSVQHPQRVWPD
jgi:hypothetical protein